MASREKKRHRRARVYPDETGDAGDEVHEEESDDNPLKRFFITATLNYLYLANRISRYVSPHTKLSSLNFWYILGQKKNSRG